MRIAVLILLLTLTCAFSGCSLNRSSQDDKARASQKSAHHGSANHHMHSASFEELVARFEDPARDEWQQPELVLDKLGDLNGKKVIDIGSGTGYFSFRLAERGAHVICGDVDQQFLDYITQRKKMREEEGRKLSGSLGSRLLPYDSPKLSKGEVDLALIVNTYHHIENRPAYFRQVKAGLRPNGQLAVVDFQKRETPMGPPVEMRLDSNEVISELKQAGFRSFHVMDNLLLYQYLILAR